jgi:hypothetical protein
MIRHLALRRGFFIVVLVAASIAAIWENEQLRATHPYLVYLTGWILFGLILALTAYNVRKKLSFVPLFSSRIWFQIHVYTGLFTGVAFVLHLRWRLPSGWFEGVLAGLFVGVTLSGIAGWWLSNVLPKRLTTAGGEVLYERIPLIRRELRLQAEALALQAIPEAKATTLADFYARELSGYFAAPQNFWASVFGSRRSVNFLLGSLSETKRYFTAVEQANADQLAELIREKDALDFQRTAQLIMKAWLFIHIPLTYGLIVFSGVHVVLVYAFSGGAR